MSGSIFVSIPGIKKNGNFERLDVLQRLRLKWVDLWIGSEILSNSDHDVNLNAVDELPSPGAAANISMSSGAWYWEIQMLKPDFAVMGVHLDGNAYGNWLTDMYHLRANTWGVNGSNTTISFTPVVNDIIGFGVDMSSGTLNAWWNGSYLGQSPYLIPGPCTPAVSNHAPQTADNAFRIFGGDPGWEFAYAIPAGYQALSDYA